mmetsp:Transcript_13380/g.39073  ORF Transcript_13380/g.39073 Transcript_13380/m.39073 type:complete len:206 (+) Transcript_13380:824-1441(+)
MSSLGWCPASSVVSTAKRFPFVSQWKPRTVSLISTMSTGMFLSRILKISRFVAPFFFVLLSFVTRRQRKSPSDCQYIDASHCVREREASSRREGISTSTSLAGLLFFSSVQMAITLSFGDHWKVCSASYLSVFFLPSSSLMRSKLSVSRTMMEDSLHSAKNLPSWLQRKCGNSVPRGATDGVRHWRTHSPVRTLKIRTALLSFSE